jgi:hypothetical protein
MEYRITYTTNKGTIYSEIEEREEEMEVGEWEQPFPNEGRNSQAYGLSECLAQSDECPLRFYEEELVKIKVELAKLEAQQHPKTKEDRG